MLLVTIAFSAWSAAAAVQSVDMVDVSTVCGSSDSCPIATTAGAPARSSAVAGGTKGEQHTLDAVWCFNSTSGAAGSNDAPAAAVKSEGPVGELTRFTTKDNVRLEGLFYAVPKSKEPLPAVLLLHDLGADREQLAPLVEKLQKRKLNVLVFDLRGHGANRTETQDWAKLDDAGRASLAPFMVNDVQAALDWMGGDTRNQAAHLHVVGQGFGALLALRAARDERVTSLTLTLPEEDLYGFTIRPLLRDVEGLATQIITTSDREDHFHEMLVEADMVDAIGLVSVKCAAAKLLDDKKLPTTLTKWIDDHRQGQPTQRTRG